MALDTALNGVRANFGTGGIRAGVKRAGVKRTDKVISITASIFESFENFEETRALPCVLMFAIINFRELKKFAKLNEREIFEYR